MRWCLLVNFRRRYRQTRGGKNGNLKSSLKSVLFRGRREERAKQKLSFLFLSICPHPQQQRQQPPLLLPFCSAAAASVAAAARSASPGTEARRPRRAGDLRRAEDRFRVFISRFRRPPQTWNPRPLRCSDFSLMCLRPSLEDSPDRGRFLRRLARHRRRHHHHHRRRHQRPLLRSSASTTSSLRPGPRAR